MSYRRLLVLYGLILLLVAAQTYSLGDDHGVAPDSPSSSSPARPDAETTLNDDTAKTLAKLFPVFTEASVKERYGSRLPTAITAAKSSANNEDPIAEIVAEIFGTLNDKQVDTLLTDVDKEIKAENEKGDRKDANKLALLWRIDEAAKSVKKKDGKADLAKFRTAFEAKFNAIKEKNKDFYTLLDQALTNDAAKRKLLGEGYDPELLLRFAKEQCATGNKSLCDKLALGLTFEAPNGDRFIDVTDKDNKNKRLAVGKKEDFEKALPDIAEQTNGFSGFKLATRPHETVADSDTIRPRPSAPPPPPPAPNGPTTNPAPPPRPVQPPPTGGTSGNPPATPTGTPGRTGTPTPTTTPTGGTSGNPPTPPQPQPPTQAQQLEARTTEVKAIAVEKCMECHSATSNRRLKFNADGSILAGTVAQVLQRTVKDGDMPEEGARNGNLSDAQKASIREWARLQGVN